MNIQDLIKQNLLQEIDDISLKQVKKRFSKVDIVNCILVFIPALIKKCYNKVTN